MPEYRLVSEDQFDALRRSVQQLEAVLADLRGEIHRVQQESGVLRLPLETVPTRRQTEHKAPEPARQGQGRDAHASMNGSHPTAPSPRYRVERGKLSYAEVALEVMDKRLFSLDEAWSKIEPLLVEPSERGRDSLRRSLKESPKFAYLPDHPAEGMWFERKDAQQPELT